MTESVNSFPPFFLTSCSSSSVLSPWVFLIYSYLHCVVWLVNLQLSLSHTLLSDSSLVFSYFWNSKPGWPTLDPRIHRSHSGMHQSLACPPITKLSSSSLLFGLLHDRTWSHFWFFCCFLLCSASEVQSSLPFWWLLLCLSTRPSAFFPWASPAPLWRSASSPNCPLTVCVWQTLKCSNSQIFLFVAFCVVYNFCMLCTLFCVALLSCTPAGWSFLSPYMQACPLPTHTADACLAAFCMLLALLGMSFTLFFTFP